MSKPPDINAVLLDFLAPYAQLKVVEELAEAGAPVPAAEASRILAKMTTWGTREITGRDGKQQTVQSSPGYWRGDVFRFSSPPNSSDMRPGVIQPLTLSRRAYLACVKADAVARQPGVQDNRPGRARRTNFDWPWFELHAHHLLRDGKGRNLKAQLREDAGKLGKLVPTTGNKRLRQLVKDAKATHAAWLAAQERRK